MTSTVSDVELLGVTEVAKILGISRQHVDQLSNSDPDFLEPVADSVVVVSNRSSIESWAKATGRGTRQAT